MEWFRMYSEFASDPKVQIMSEAMQRRLMMLLCLRCSNTLVTLQDDEIALALRITVEDLAETKALFMRKNFIDEAWEILQWDKRQFVSDSSAPRVAKHRAKLKAEAEQACNVTVTPQNRTDTEQIQNRTEQKKPSATPDGDLFAGIDSQVVTDFKAMRSKQKAAITKTVITGIQREADKAGVSLEDALRLCCERGWRGFKAEWVVGQARASPQPIDLAAAQKAANDEAKRRLFGSDEGRTINA